MKKIVTKETVPAVEAYEYDVEQYECDIGDCKVSCENEYMYKVHYGIHHSVKAVVKVGEQEWFKFESEEDFKLYHNSRGGRGGSYKTGRWDGPGWYIMWCEEEPCGRGCGSDFVTRGKSLISYASEIAEQVKKLNQTLAELAELKEK